jgi:hypothetical protein
VARQSVREARDKQDERKCRGQEMMPALIDAGKG